MKIFQLQNNSIIFDPEILLIPEFQVLYNRDKSKGKVESFTEFEYVFFVCDWNSPYRTYTNIKERKAKVQKDYIKNSKWVEDDSILDALTKYEELTKTPLMGLIEDAYTMIDKLRLFFKSADFVKLDKLGKRVDKAEDGMKNLERLGKIVESIKKLEEMAASEKLEKSNVRGNRSVSYDER